MKVDSGASSGSVEKVQDKLFDIFGTTLRIKLSKILGNIGLFVPQS